MAPPSRSGLKGWLLGLLEARGYLLLNTHKMARRDTWLSELGIATVLDVGANHGESALGATIEKVPAARIISFEPLPDSYAAMEANLKGHALVARLQRRRRAGGRQVGHPPFGVFALQLPAPNGRPA